MKKQKGRLDDAGELNETLEKRLDAADALLRESEDRFSTVFRACPVGIGISRLADGRFIEINDAFLGIYGYERQEIIGHTSDEMRLWADPIQRASVVATLREKRSVRNVEMECRRKSGEIGYLLVSAEAIELAGETCFLGTFYDITKRKKIEEAFRENERRYQMVLDDQTDVICRVKADGSFTFVNDVYCRFFGKNREELMAGKWQPIAYSDDVPLVEERLRSLTPANPVVVIENRVIDSAGEIRWMQFINSGLFDKDGRLVETQAVGRDITERKKIEQELRDSEERYRRLFETETDAILVADQENLSYIDVNPAAQKMYGYSLKEFLQLTTYDTSAEPENTRQALAAHIKWVPYRLHRKKDGTVFPIEIAVSYFEYRGREVHVAAVRDITERMRIEEALKASEERLKLALTSSQMGVWEWNIRTNALFWSPECFAILGTDKFSGTLDSFTDQLHPEDAGRVWTTINNALSEKTIYTAEFRILRPDGEVRWLSDLGRAEYDEDGKPIRLVGTVQDITERKRAEQELYLTKHCLDTASISILIISPDNRIVWVNDHACKSLGYSREELCAISTPDIDPVITPARIAGLRQKMKEQGYVIFETINQRKDGSRFPVEIRANDLEFEGKEISICFVQDISKRKRIEQELINRQALINSMAQELSVTEERERLRIAEELHDQIAPKLLLVKMRIQSLVDLLQGGVDDDAIESIMALIDQSISGISSLTLQLRPPILANAGLEAALKWLAEEFNENYGLVVKITDDKTFKPMRYEIRSAIFQIVRELLLNVVKHAATKNAWITIKRRNDKIDITIEDDGCGTELSNFSCDKPKPGGFGIYNTRMKIEHLGGELVIDSSPGSGTRAYISAPLDSALTEEE
jgi:PAS domain S-box-containing protein